MKKALITIAAIIFLFSCKKNTSDLIEKKEKPTAYKNMTYTETQEPGRPNIVDLVFKYPGKLDVWVSGYRQIRGRDTTFVALATNGDCLLNAIRSCLAFPPCSTLCGGGGGVAWLACIQAWQFACFFK